MKIWDMPKLPAPERLEKQMRILAALDLMMCEEEWLRVHRYDSSWSDDETMGSLNNGAGDVVFVVFAPEGAIIKGFDHESPYSPHAQEEYGTWPGIYDEVPEALLHRIQDVAFTYEDVTFCIWWENGNSAWHISEYEQPGGWEDGADFLLGYLCDSPESYQEWAQGYFEEELDLAAVRAVFEGAEITKELIASLNPERDAEEALEELEALGLLALS
ncbi:hypothetical protein [Paenibacillus sp. Leaf72]|uniref:hypothetical protein n=1 Tax=Paenibacillus sp. Leaf72 TaxID=1736234 RepID=UPI0006F1C90D|nr:hypothetical protein [Paenibacillus sp. Leaf72]KQO17851.1 hypothetical protein ASF12_04120 [Paenibacillus sp. Leaf72]